MSSNVEPEEAQAIREMVNPQGQPPQEKPVARRNFAEPRRLSGDALKALAKKITAALPSASNELITPLRKLHKLTFGSVAEINASRLFQGMPSPFLIWCYQCNEQLGWLIWDAAAGRRLIETILCGKYDESSPGRRFSPAECRVLEKIFLVLVGAIARTFGLEPRSLRIAQDAEELNGYEEIPGSADKQRLMVHTSFDGPGGPSDVRIYLPGVFAEEEAADDRAKPIAGLPEHARDVTVLLSAYLGSVDVSLSELLGLEVGDVLPLEVDSDSHLELFVEDRASARARWGTHKGQLAVKVLSIEPRPLEIDQPEA